MVTTATSIDFNKVNPRFIDCVFPKEERYTFGALPPNELREYMQTMRAFEDVVAPLPSSQWIEIAKETLNQQAGAEWLVTRIFDQGQEGSCVANAEGQETELLQALQWGRDKVVHMSAMSLYQLIGSSAQSGAYVEYGLSTMAKVGMLPLDTPENRAVYGDAVMPNTGWRTPRPANWQSTAALFCHDEQLVIRTYEGLVTAMLMGYFGCVGRQGHSICYAGCPQFTTSSVNSIRQPYPNSWRIDWGVALGNMAGGFGFDTYSTIRQSAGYIAIARSLVDRSKK